MPIKSTGPSPGNYTDNYSYDLNSNRVSETEDQGNTGSTTDTVTSTYNADDELVKSVDAGTGETDYSYDPNGSQIKVATPTSTTTNEYDLQGQMAGTQTANSSGTTEATYEYGDQGNRIIETNTNTAGTTTTAYYLIDSQSPTGHPQTVEQSATAGQPQITYIWGKTLISQTYATGATIPGVGTASSPTTYYMLTDAHGSTRVIVNASGVIVQRLNYDAFGNALGFTASTALTTQLYDSMSFDPASGNYYDGARFYSASTGEFTQADYGNYGSLADPMSGLPYSFTGGDPINMLDLNGHQDEVEELEVASLGSWLDTAFARGVQVVSQFARPAIALLTSGADWIVTQGQNALQFLQGMGTGAISVLQQAFLTQEQAITEEEAQAGPAWDTFDAAKGYLNKLITGTENNPEGIEWHHLVSQTAQRFAGFSARAINSAATLVPTPGPIHQAITSFFNSGAEWLPTAENGGSYSTILQYVTRLPWNQQYQIGLKIWQAAMYNQNLQQVGQQIVQNAGQRGRRMAEWIESLLNKGTERWPESLHANFSGNFAMGVFYFRDGDPAKEKFLAACGELSVEIVRRKRHLMIKREELANYPYYYLRVINDGDPDLVVDNDAFLDRSTACPSGKGMGRCTTGVVQCGAIEIQKPPQTDIIQLFSASRFNIYIVSKRLKDALESMKATGVEFLPCKGQQGEVFFQLRVTGEALAPPNAGKIDIVKRCPSCGVIRAYYAEFARFSAGALAPFDFQSCKSFRSGDDVYQAMHDSDIISSRIQAVLAGDEFTGWKRYLDGPPVDYGVVEIEGAPWLR